MRKKREVKGSMAGRKKEVAKRKKGVLIPVTLAEQLEAYATEADVPQNRIVSLALTLLFKQDRHDLMEALQTLKGIWVPPEEDG